MTSKSSKGAPERPPEWFRNATWDESIERTFNEKLRRARRKEQYLRIQASTLARRHPEVALALLDRYFVLPDDFDHAQAYVDRASALLALGRTADAISAYEAALAREAAFPKLLTQACLHLPYLIATLSLRERYPRALEALALCEGRGMMFAVDRFLWHATHAIIAADSGDAEIGTGHAEKALAAASAESSGFRHHPSVGLVTSAYDSVIARMKSLSRR